MQVDRQPSPWPCVVMLVILSVLCLMVPRYWRHEAELSKAPSARPLLPHQVPRIADDGASGRLGIFGNDGPISERSFIRSQLCGHFRNAID